MNYRHAFHAGNFADLVKHAALLLILDRLAADGGPLLVVDSHAGAGLYDLQGELARKAGEAEAGIVRLMADKGAPEGLAGLKAAVAGANPEGGLRFYPGSPRLIAERLRPGDAYVGAELRPEDAQSLRQALAPFAGRVRIVQGDGYALVQAMASDPRRLLALIDPPFERPDDYAQAAQAAAALLARRHPTTALIWLPLKDLETFDAFVRRIEALHPRDALAVEARLRPLSDPMRMNGCALVLLNPPDGLEPALEAAAAWAARSGGEPGALAKLWRLNT